MVAKRLHFFSDSSGSNNWVVGGEKSATGQPLLANDPHLDAMMPSIWYETGLHGAGFDVTGVSLPGCPLVVIGRNKDISWGITNLPADVQDFFIEKINPSNGMQYEFKGEWKTMQVVDESIPVKGRSAPEALKVRITRHGPLMDNVIAGLGQPLALQWTGASQNRLLKAVYLMDRAKDWDEFRRALAYWDAPGQNIVYADRGEHRLPGDRADTHPRQKGRGWCRLPAGAENTTGRDISPMKRCPAYSIRPLISWPRPITRSCPTATPIS